MPTRRRAEYLDVALGSITAQARAVSAEVVVISDGADRDAAAVADRHGVRITALAQPSGLNAARNAAVREAASDLIVFIDDDVHAPEGWLRALLEGTAGHADTDVFGGPIRACLEGGGPRACGRESAPITTLDLGPHDREVALVWGANMAIRRRAFAEVGPFDESLAGRGDEEEWQSRYARAGGRTRYIAAAGLHHRRTRADCTVRALSRAAYALGRTSRGNDVRKGVAPPLAGELRTLLGCVWHIFRRRCAVGIVMTAQASGRLREALAR